MCPSCHRAYTREHYKNNKQAYLDKAKRNSDRYRRQAKELIWAHLSNNTCVDCGESDPVVLEFDHLVPSEKSFNISDACRRGDSVDKIEAEISKCVVRCANCHRRKTAEQFGWWRSQAQVCPPATNGLKG